MIFGGENNFLNSGSRKNEAKPFQIKIQHVLYQDEIKEEVSIMKSESQKKGSSLQKRETAEEEKDNFDTSQLNIDVLKSVFQTFKSGYITQTPKQIKLMDAFVLYCFLLIVIQFVYYFILGNFPQNSLIIGIFTPLGSAVLTICLRQQINDKTKYMNVSRERSFWEYFISMYIMFLACINYLG